MATAVAIIGVGLMGGSLGMALKNNAPEKYRIIGIGRHADRLALARRRGAIDVCFTDYAAGVRQADIIVICSPVSVIASIVKEIVPFVKKGALITDVGSVKGSVVKDVSAILPRNMRSSFVGAHPMAGNERSGVAAASARLYQDAVVVIDPAHMAAARKIAGLWKDAGADPLWLAPSLHDALVARTSHLPHVLAYGLCALAGKRNKHGAASRIVAGSFRDLTRIADSDPAAWAAIGHANAAQLAAAIDEMIAVLTKAKQLLHSPKALERFLTRGHQCRAQLITKGSR